MIGVLREDTGESLTQPPQPTLTDLPALVEESRAAGMRIYRTDRAGRRGAARRRRPHRVPDRAGRSDQRAQARARSRRHAHRPRARQRSAGRGPHPRAGGRRLGTAAARSRDRLDRPRRARHARRRRARARRRPRRRLRPARPPAAMIRVLLADDDALVRRGLRIMLAAATSVEVVAEVADGREVLGAIDLHRPDVILMDIRMPQLDGIAATRLGRGAARPARRPRPHDIRRRRARPARAAGRRRRLPAQGHPADGDRPRDRARPRRRQRALSRRDPPADLARGRRLGRRRSRRAGPRPTGHAQPARARRRARYRPRTRQRRDRRDTAPLSRRLSKATSPASSTSSRSTTASRSPCSCRKRASIPVVQRRRLVASRRPGLKRWTRPSRQRPVALILLLWPRGTRSIRSRGARIRS